MRWVVRAGGLAVLLGADWPDVSAPIAPERDGRDDVALIIAIENYTYVEDVRGARANAEAWRQYLTDVRGVPEVKLLLDQHAVKEEVEAWLGAVPRSSSGRAWVVFIGHGAPPVDASSSDGVLMLADVQSTELSVRARAMPRGALIGAMETARPEVVAFLDACFSGTFAGGTAKLPGTQVARPVSERIGSRSVVLTAARSDEVAGDLPGLGRPAFSYLALGALRGWAERDGRPGITASEITAYTGQVLRTTVSGRLQTPTVYPADGALVVASPTSGEGPPTFPVAQADGTDLGAVAARLEAARRMQDEALADQARLVAEAGQDRRQRLEAAMLGLQAAARHDWETGAMVVAGGGAEAREFAEAFVDKYAPKGREPSVSVGDGGEVTTEPVVLPELDLARKLVDSGPRRSEIRIDRRSVSASDGDEGHYSRAATILAVPMLAASLTGLALTVVASDNLQDADLRSTDSELQNQLTMGIAGEAVFWTFGVGTLGLATSAVVVGRW